LSKYKIKIVLIRYNNTPFGGAERYLQRLDEALKNRGYETEILHADLPEWLPSWLKVLLFSKKICTLKSKIQNPKSKIFFSLDRITCPDIYRAGDGFHRAFLKSKGFTLNPLHLSYLWLEKRTFENAKVIIANSRLVKKQILEHYPEQVTSVLAMIGRSEKGETAQGNYMEILLTLDKDIGDIGSLASKMTHQLQSHFNYVQFVPTQPIAMRIEELLEGVKAELAVKIYGETTMDDVEKAILGIRQYKPSIIILNKADLPGAKEKAEEFLRSFDGSSPVLIVSAKTKEGQEKLGPTLVTLLDLVRVYTKKPNGDIAEKPLICQIF